MFSLRGSIGSVVDFYPVRAGFESHMGQILFAQNYNEFFLQLFTSISRDRKIGVLNHIHILNIQFFPDFLR